MVLKIEKYLRVKKANFYYFFLITFLSFLILEFIEIPFLLDKGAIKFAFDTNTYLDRANELSNFNSISLFTFFEMAISNSFGPVILGAITSNNYYLIWLFNLIVYFICSSYLIRVLDLKASFFHLLIFINVITWISIVSLNKEIFAFASLAALVYFMQKKNLYRFLILIISSFLVRSQMVFFVLVIVFVFSKFMLFKNYRRLHIVIFLLLMSLTLPIYTEALRGSIEFWRNQTIALRGEGSGLYMVWINMDKNFLYMFSFPFKLIHLTVLNAIEFLINPKIELKYFHNFAETLQSFSFIFLYFVLLKKKVLRTFQNDLFYISAFYFMIFVAVQIFTPRYLYPGYILLTILITSRISYLPQSNLLRD